MFADMEIGLKYICPTDNLLIFKAWLAWKLLIVEYNFEIKYT